MTPLALVEAVDVPEEAADSLVDTLVQAGLLEWSSRAGEWIEVTEEGLSFSQATITTVTRKTADRVLSEFLGRVSEINADSDANFNDTKVVVFGSYLGDEERIGDVDVAVDVVRVRPLQPDEDIYAPELPTWRRLKKRSRTLSLVGLERHREWLADKPHKVAFTDVEAVERGAAFQRSLHDRTR